MTLFAFNGVADSLVNETIRPSLFLYLAEQVTTGSPEQRNERENSFSNTVQWKGTDVVPS